MGCLVGSVAQFKNQNEVNYLPLELSADEVTLAATQGWIELFPETAAPVRAIAARAEAAAAAAAAANGGGGGAGPSGGVAGGRRRGGGGWPSEDWDEAYHEYYSQFDPRLGFTGRYLPVLGAKRRQLSQQGRQGQGQEQGGQQQPGQQQPAQQPLACTAGEPGAPPVAAASGRRAEGIQDGPSGGGGEAATAAAGPDLSEAGWQAAVAEGAAYSIPLTAAAAAAARAGLGAAAAAGPKAAVKAAAGPRGGADGAGAEATAERPAAAGAEADVVMGDEAAERPAASAGAAEAEAGQPDATAEGSPSDGGIGRVGWSYPRTDYERLRFAVFADLHRQGFMMTGGIKFGSDLLAYPGDPTLYHAQFTVRPVPPGQALQPMLLKAVARGSHAARKHLLLATYATDEDAGGGECGGGDGGPVRPQPRIRFMSLAPEAGFGSKA